MVVVVLRRFWFWCCVEVGDVVVVKLGVWVWLGFWVCVLFWDYVEVCRDVVVEVSVWLGCVVVYVGLLGGVVVCFMLVLSEGVFEEVLLEVLGIFLLLVLVICNCEFEIFV